MKFQMRNNIWETNSSSVHTLQISSELMGANELVVKSDGYVYVNLDKYYGREFHEYKTQEEKLKYVCTWMYVFYNCDLDEMLDGYNWEEFENEFCKYVNHHTNQKCTNLCAGIKINFIEPEYDNYGTAGDFLDHQSCPYGSHDDDGFILDIYDSKMLVNFIFNPYMWLRTESD